MDLSTYPTGECSTYLKTPICLSLAILEKLNKQFKIPDNPDVKEELEDIKEKLQCDSEACILSHPEVINTIGKDTAKNEKLRLKPYGPAHSNAWFSNVHIDNILQQWSIEYKDFYNYPFAMIDFIEKGHELITQPPPAIYERGKRCAGCVVNTDRSSGNGQHWMAIFVDMRDTPDKDNEKNAVWTIEFFNSTGRMYKAITEYFAIISNGLHNYVKDWSTPPEIKTINVSKIVHQYSNDACGPYSLYYIRSRLQNVSYSAFEFTRIPDERMNEFRELLFRDYK